MHHFNRPKIGNNSLIRDQKFNKHIANGYKKLVHTFKREAVQIFVAKNLAVNHLPLEALPAVQTWTANCKRDRKAVVTWHFAVCGLPFPTENLMLKVPNSLGATDVSCSFRFQYRAGPVLGQITSPIGCTRGLYVIFYTITSRSREHPGRRTHLNKWHGNCAAVLRR